MRKEVDNMSDNRAISRTLFDKLLDKNGIYHQFYMFVLEHKNELVLCFRGNGNPESIMIYHNNHIVWELCGDEDKIGISFNHARYSENWTDIRAELDKLGFGVRDKDGELIEPDRADSIGMLYCMCASNKFCSDPAGFVRESYKLVMNMMNDFFAPKKEIDYDFFKKCDTKYKKNLAEKRWQQKLFNDLKFYQNGLFAYDLEFSQPDGVNQSESNEPDMLALRYENGLPVAIVLVEVKSLGSACRPSGKSKSDIYSHIRGMKSYSKSKNINNRRKEAHDILQLYKELGLYVKDDQMIPDLNNELPIECLLIFTTADLIDVGYKIPSSESAIHYYLNNKEKINRFVNDKDWCCKVICVGSFAKNRRYDAKEYHLPSEWK